MFFPIVSAIEYWYDCSKWSWCKPFGPWLFWFAVQIALQVWACVWVTKFYRKTGLTDTLPVSDQLFEDSQNLHTGQAPRLEESVEQLDQTNEMPIPDTFDEAVSSGSDKSD